MHSLIKVQYKKSYLSTISFLQHLSTVFTPDRYGKVEGEAVPVLLIKDCVKKMYEGVYV